MLRSMMDTRTPTSPENLYFDDFKPAPSEVQRPAVASSSTSRDTGTTSTTMSSRAIVENAKVFPLFAKRLASHDVKEFTTTANKMKNWLSSEKAYYPDALRNIVSLLEIAHSTFTTRLMQTDSSALATVDIYQALMSAVVPFLHYFREGDLQLRLKHLIQSSSDVLTNFTSLVRAEGEVTLHECKNTLSVITSARDDTPSTQLIFPTALVQSPTTMHTPSMHIPCSDTPADHPPNVTSPTIVSKPQPKRLLKGSSLSEHLKNRDLEWFKAHQQPASPVVDPPTQPSELESIYDAAGPSAAEKLRPSRMPVRIVPSRLPPSQPMTSTELIAPANSVDQSSTSPSTNAPAPTDVKESDEKSIAPAVIDVAMSDPQPEGVHQVSEALPSQASESAVPEVPTPEGTDVKESNEKSIAPAVTVAMSDPQPEGVHQVSEALPSQAPESAVPEVPTPEGTDVKESNEKSIAPAVIDVAMSDPQPEGVYQVSEALPSQATESAVPEVPTPEGTTLSAKSSTESPAPTQPPSTSSDDVGGESYGGDSLPSRVIDAPLQVVYPRFGGEMAVMIFRQGLQSPRGTLQINFDLDDIRYSQIARWAKRRLSPTNLESSVCVSLACYHLPSLLPDSPEDGELPPFETLTMHTPCEWPTTGDLSLQTKRDGKDFVIPLAPPLFVTPDNCVDISAFIRNGENAFSVVQQSDMSEYMFMFHAHHPTPAQLKYLASCRQKREEWARTIRVLYKPEPTESLWSRSPSRS